MKTHQNNTAYKILDFFHQKWQSYKAFLIYTNYDVIMTSYKPFKNRQFFEKYTSKYPSLPNFAFLP